MLHDSKMESIDISKAGNLSKFELKRNVVHIFTVGENPLLTKLYLGDQNMNELKISEYSINNNLEELWLWRNKIISLDLANFNNLKVLNASDNKIKSLTLSDSGKI